LIAPGGAALVSVLHADTPKNDPKNDPRNDYGTYRVYQNDRALGTETFSFLTTGDSVIVSSRVMQIIPSPEGVDTLDKSIALTVGSFDYDLRGYVSRQKFQGAQLVRGLVLQDTV